jgi:hypothetical protein
MILRKKQAGHQPQTKVEKRVSRISTPELIIWMEQATISVGKHIAHWQRDQSSDDLNEVVMAAEVFHAIAKELKRREEFKVQL